MAGQGVVTDESPVLPAGEVTPGIDPTWRWLVRIAYLVAVVGAAALCLTLAGRRPGWPIGQTPGNDIVLVQVYAAHFRHGDLFPVWSSSDAYGLGSPVLLFYQKVFFIVGAVVLIISGGALKASLIVTLALFMVVGAYGMRSALAQVTDSALVQIVGSLGFLFSNEAFTEWLTRGDLAEFSALMVVPWLLRWCLLLLRERRMSWSIVPVMVVLVDAHNAVALVSIITLVVTGVTFLVTAGLGGLRSIARRLVIAIAATTAILAPMLVAELEMSQYYDPATKVTEFGGRVSQNYADPIWYLYDSAFTWLGRVNRSPVLVQLDLAVTVLLGIGFATVVVRWVGQGRSPSRSVGVHRPTVAMLLVSMGAYLFLQLRISHPVYDLLAPLKVISFPYRMMTFITPLAFLLGAVVVDWYMRQARERWSKRWNDRRRWVSRMLPVALASVWLVAMVGLSPVTAREPAPQPGPFPDAPFLPTRVLTPPKTESFETDQIPVLFAEYLPRVFSTGGRGELYTDIFLYQALHKGHREAESLSPSVPCSVAEASGTPFEALRIRYAVTCAGATRLALPISYNPFTTIDEVGAHGTERHLAVLHVDTDPRIVVQIGGPGPRTLVAHLPTLSGILFSSWP